MHHHRKSIALACTLLVALGACGKPQPPDKEQPPEPQAQRSELRDAVQQPIERARQADADVQKAAEAQRAAIDAATGG
jgi:hypothetical protein